MPYDPKVHGPKRVVGPGFHQQVHREVQRTPPGTVTTYGDVAARLGHRRAARQVGFALAAIPEGLDVPWHRVVPSTGRLSFPADSDQGRRQTKLLGAEGVEVKDGRVVGFRALRWPG